MAFQFIHNAKIKKKYAHHVKFYLPVCDDTTLALLQDDLKRIFT